MLLRMRPVLVLLCVMSVARCMPHHPAEVSGGSGEETDEQFLASLLGGVPADVELSMVTEAQSVESHGDLQEYNEEEKTHVVSSLEEEQRTVEEEQAVAASEVVEVVGDRQSVLQQSDAELLASLGVNSGESLGRCDGGHHVCVPYYLCNPDGIITDGAGLIDIRFNPGQQPDEHISHSECPNYIDVCCAEPVPRQNVTEPRYEPRCGRRNQHGVNARIVGFTQSQTQFGEFPWMTAVLRREQLDGEERNLYVCGGALIHPRLVLTAAHCVANLPAAVTRVRLGEWDTKYTHEFYPHQDLDVLQVVTHPTFNQKNLHNDVALLVLASDVQLQEHIDTLCLPDPTVSLDGRRCIATGWGKDRFNNGSFQTVLKAVELERVNHAQCQQSLRGTRLGEYFRLDSSFTCAAAPSQSASYDGPAADTCTGDGGSPLACPIGQDRYVHGGIVAWGIGCGEQGVPGVYADPAQFVQWIVEQAGALLQVDPGYWGLASVRSPKSVAETLVDVPQAKSLTSSQEE